MTQRHSAPRCREWVIPAGRVHSLVWDGDRLVDWADGGVTHELDGTTGRRFIVGYAFDAALASPSREFAFIYQKLGTKGLVPHQGEVVREANRSFYFADTYEYPVALFRTPDGREAIAHCPEAYNRIEIEDLATGERLTQCANREPEDLFHSRLSVDPTGTLLLSAGWVWHPYDFLAVYEVGRALGDPGHLDSFGILEDVHEDVHSAAFLPNGRLVMDRSGETFRGDEAHRIEVYDVPNRTVVSSAPLAEPAGTLMPVGAEWVVAFYGCPKLLDLRTGEVLRRWPRLRTGKQSGSMLQGAGRVPPMAFDVPGRRFAVATRSSIHVIQIGRPA